MAKILEVDTVEGQNFRAELLKAACSGNYSVLRILLEKCRSVNLVYIAQNALKRNKSIQLLRTLQEHGLNIKESGNELLPEAAPDLVAVRWLLDHGADASSERPRMCNTNPILNNAAYHGNLAVFNLLLENGARLETSVPLHFAAVQPSPSKEWRHFVDDMLNRGLDINALDTQQAIYSKGTPLHLSVYTNAIEAAKYLLDRGADPNVGDNEGESALGLARRLNMPRWVSMFDQSEDSDTSFEED